MSWFSKIIRKGKKEIGDTVDDVIEAVDDTKDFLVDDVLDPITEAAEDVYKAIEDDPLYNIAKIGAVATGNSWALPLIDGAKVANNGGDWRDIAEASAKAYIAGKVGSSAGSATNAYVSEAVNSEVAGAIIGQATGRAASTAVMSNGDLNAVRDSFITGGISAGVDEAFAWMDETSGTYADLNQSVKNVVTTYVKAEANNQDVTNEMMANAALSGAITSDLMKKYIDTDSSLSEAELAAITSGFTRTLSAAMAGGNVEREAMTAISNYGSIQMKEWMDTTGKNLVNKGLDRITGAYSEAELAATRLDGSRQFLDNVYIKEYNEVVAKFRPEMEARDAAYEEYVDAWEANQIQPSKATYDAAMEARQNYLNASTSFQNKFQTYEYEYNQKRVALNGAYNNLEDNQKLYEEAVANLRQNADQMSDDLKPLYEIQNKIVAEALTGGKGNFNAEEYIRLNELDPDTDAFEHYLKEGRATGAPISEADYTQQLEEEQTVAVQRLLGDLGIKQSRLTDSQETILRDYFGNMTLAQLRATDATQISDDVVNLFIEDFKDPDNKEIYTTGNGQEFTAQELVGLLDTPEDNPAGTTAKEFIKLTNEVQTGQQDYDITFADGVTHTDVLSGRAELNVIERDGKKLYQWQDLSFAPKIPKYNKELGMYTQVQESFDDKGQLNYVETLSDGTIYNNYTARVAPGAGEDGQDFYEILNYKGTIKNGKNLVSDVDAEELFAVSTTTRNTLDRVQRENVAAFTNTVGQMAKTASSAVYDFYTEPFLELARNVYDGSETVQNIVDSDNFQEIVVNTSLKATSGFAKAANFAVVLANIDPTSTPLYETAQDLEEIAKGVTSEAYQQSIKNIDTKIANANFELDEKGKPVLDQDGNPILLTRKDGSPISAVERALNTGKAIAGAAWENKKAFLVEKIGVDLVQELGLFAISGGAANVTKQMLKQMGSRAAEEYGKRVGFTTAQMLNAAEAFGGAGQQAYDEAFATALKAGATQEEASAYAGNIGLNAAGIGLLGWTAFNTGVDAATLNRKFFGGNRTSGFEEGVEILFRETLSEGVEEGLPTAYVESQLSLIDPSRDSVGNLTANALLGMIAGAGTTSSFLGASSGYDATANVLTMFDPDIKTIVSSTPNTQEGAASLQQELVARGITDPSVQTSVLNTVYDEGYVSPTEAYDAAVNYSQNSEIPYSFNAQDINSFVGANPEADLGTSVANYAGQRVTSDFVNDQISQYGYGYTPAQADIDALINSGFITNEQTKKDKTQQVIDYLDPFVNSEQDVRKAYTEIGVNPDTVNQNDIDRFIGQVDPNKDLTSTLRDFVSSPTPTPDPVVDPIRTPTPDPVVDPTPTPEPQPDIVDVVTDTQPDVNTQPDVTTDINTQPDTAVNTQPDTNQNLDTNSNINLVQQVEDELLRVITGAGAQQNQEYAARLAGQQQVDVKSPDPAQINYFYDFSSIFANPSQEQKFPSPYREGGSVDATDEILKIMRTK